MCRRIILKTVYKLIPILSIFVHQLTYAQCSFTPEQTRLINLAASYGEPYDYKKTLAAIVVQESFVGEYVVRVNSGDGKYGSYGVTHILLESAMWLEGEDSSWKAKSKIVPRLINDDLYALQLAVKKLDTVNNGNWIETWNRYNGNSKTYGIKIRDHIRNLESCGFFKGWG